MSGAAGIAPMPAPTLRRAAEGVALAALGRGGGLLATAIFAALLPMAAFGAFAHARGFLTLLAPLVSLGMAVATTRWLPQLRAAGSGREAAGHLACGYAATVILGGGAALGAAAAGDALLAATLAGLPGAGGLFLGAQAARALGRSSCSYLPLGAGALGGAATAAVALAAGAAPSAELAAASASFAATVAAASQAAALFAGLGRPRFEAPRRWLVEAAPLTASLAARGWTLQGPFLLLGLWAPAEALGVYGLCLAASQAARVCASGVNGTAIQSLSLAVGCGAQEEARRIRIWSQRASAAAAALGGAALVAAWAALGDGVGGDGFLAVGAAPLALLMAAAVVQSVEAPLGQALIGAGRGGAELRTQAAGACAATGLALALSPVFGASGAAFATLAAAALRWRMLSGAARVGGALSPMRSGGVQDRAAAAAPPRAAVRDASGRAGS